MVSLYPKRDIVSEPFVEQLDVVDKTLIEAQNQPSSIYTMKRKPYAGRGFHKNIHTQGNIAGTHTGVSQMAHTSSGNTTVGSSNSGLNGMAGLGGNPGGVASSGSLGPQTISAPVIPSGIPGTGMGQRLGGNVDNAYGFDYASYLNGPTAFNGVYQSSPSPTNAHSQQGLTVNAPAPLIGGTDSFKPQQPSLNFNPPNVFDPFSSTFDNSNLLGNFKHNNLSSNIWGNGNSGSITTDATVWG